MALQPAGLSSDTIDSNPSASSPLPAMASDQWSDTHDTAVDEDERDGQEVVSAAPEEVGVGKAQVVTPDKSVASPLGIVEPPEPRPQEGAQEPSSDVEATSVRSMPIVQVTEPSSPAPASAQSASHFPTSSSGSGLSPHPSSSNTSARRNRHRSTLDVGPVSALSSDECC